MISHTYSTTNCNFYYYYYYYIFFFCQNYLLALKIKTTNLRMSLRNVSIDWQRFFVWEKNENKLQLQ